MTLESHEQPILIASYASGSASIAQINAATKEAWRVIVSNPADRAQAAEILGVSPNDLPDSSPFSASAGEAGLGVVEGAILFFAIDFAKDVVYDLAKDQAKEALKKSFYRLWSFLVHPRVESQLRMDGLGAETKFDDDSKR
jgi:hypothetical protein